MSEANKKQARLGVRSGVGAAGEQIGAYRIERQLGKGTFGAVYRVRHVTTGAVRALKLLSHTSDTTERMRFRREAELQAKLDQHPNVLRVHEAGEHRGQDYLVLDYAPNGTLADRMRLGALPTEQALQVTIDIARALQHLHAHGVLHRDLKPANVLFAEDGRLLLADFGLARGEGTSSLTASGLVVGSPLYMSPEQADASRELSPATDLYSLGTILFALLAGRPPFTKTGSVLTLLDEVVHTPPPALESVCSEVDPRLAAIVRRCLEKDPAKRPASATELEQELRAALEPAATSGVGKPALLIGAASLVLLAALGVGAVLYAGPNVTPKPPLAKEPGDTAPPPPPVEAGPDVTPLIDALRAGLPERAERAWQALTPDLGRVSQASLEELVAVATERGVEVAREDHAEFPPLVAVCAKVIGSCGSTTNPSTEFSTALLREAVRRAKAVDGSPELAGVALDWIEPACAALGEHAVPTLDLEALLLIDEVWRPTQNPFREHVKRQFAVLTSLIRAGVLPSLKLTANLPPHVLRRGPPIERFLISLAQSSQLNLTSEPMTRNPEIAGKLQINLEAILELHGDELPLAARNVIGLWLAHARDAETRLAELERLAVDLLPYQPRLKLAVALAALYRVSRQQGDADLARAAKLSKAMIAEIDPEWIRRAYASDPISGSNGEILTAVFLSYLANGEFAAYRDLQADIGETLQVPMLISQNCPDWLKEALEIAQGER